MQQERYRKIPLKKKRFHLYEVSRAVTFLETESRTVVVGGWGSRKQGVTVEWVQCHLR